MLDSFWQVIPISIYCCFWKVQKKGWILSTGWYQSHQWTVLLLWNSIFCTSSCFCKNRIPLKRYQRGCTTTNCTRGGKTILGICCPNLSRCCPPVLSQDAVRTQDGWDGLVFFLTVSNGPYLSNAKFTYKYKYRSRCDEDFNSKDSGWENWSHKS